MRVTIRQRSPWAGFPRVRRLIALPMLVVGFGAIGLSPLVVTEAHAACPSGTRYIGGCCYKVKGVEIDAEVNHTGQLRRDPKAVSASIVPAGNGILFCVNKPGKQPPGQKIIPVPLGTTLECSTQVQNNDVVSPQNGGTAQVACIANLEGADLRNLDQFCATGQQAIDFVPITFLSGVTYSDEDGAIETARHSCTLPNPETLAWDRALNRPEPRDYECIDAP